MPSILDIAPPEISAKEIEIRGVQLKLSGIPAIDWAQIYARYPVLRAQMTGAHEGPLPVIVSVAINVAVIAAGVGQLGNPEVEHAVSHNLTLDEQNMLFEEILKLSLPGHVIAPLLDGEPLAPMPPLNGSGGGQSAALDTSLPRTSSH